MHGLEYSVVRKNAHIDVWEIQLITMLVTTKAVPHLPGDAVHYEDSCSASNTHRDLSDFVF